MNRCIRYHFPDSVHKGKKLLHQDVDSVHKGFYSVHKAADSVHKEIDSVHKNHETTKKQRQKLLKIAAPSRYNKRLSPKKTEHIILDLCRECWLTRRELAELLDRNADSIRSRFLTQLVEHGFLQLRYPEKPTRTDQAYRTAVTMNQKKSE